MKQIGAALFAVVTWCCASLANGHEVRPAFLQLQEVQAQQFEVLWKQPVLQDRRLPLTPTFPDGCGLTESGNAERTADALLNRYILDCDLRTGSLGIDGLTRTLTDVLVRIDYLDGEQVQSLLRADAPSMDLANAGTAVMSYLIIGVEHLVFGIDHILFVVGLVLYIRGGWPLLKTITAFTLAHSVTLALSVLDLVRVPQAPVEAIIALSILFLARELVLPGAERSQITQHRPWVMAFGFGLLHGFGFAGALADIGLPQGQLALALFLFNLGIELGQLLVVGALIGLLWGIGKLFRGSATPSMGHTNEVGGGAAVQPADRPLTLPVAALIGCIAAYWTIDRIWQILF